MTEIKPKKETHNAYIVLHEQRLYSLRGYCEAMAIPYKTILMRVWRWHKHVLNEVIFFDTDIPEDAEILSKEHYPIGTPDYAEKIRRKSAAEQRIKRSTQRRALQLLRDYGNPKDTGEFGNRLRMAGEGSGGDSEDGGLLP